MQKKWLIGCSGFHYREWREHFYPKGLTQSKWFGYYAEHFNTLELNVSFYRFPRLSSLQNWHDKAPEGFVFSAKVPRSITHFKKFEGTEIMLNDFYTVLREGLREKLGCVLFQLPPQLAYDPVKLDKILGQTDPSFTNVIEFRNETWWREDVQQRLTEKNISFSGVSFPKIVHDSPVVNASTVYYRFHGVPRLFYSEYEEGFLKKVVQEIACNEKAETVYLYFNNTASMAALHNAKFVQQLINEYC